MSYYLIYVRPSQELENKFLDFRNKHSNIIYDFPSTGFHCTLFGAYFNETNEKKIIQTLEEINENKFFLTTREFIHFAKHAFVLGLDKPEALEKIHIHIAENLKDYILKLNKNPYPYFDKDEERREAFREYGSPFYGKFYSPHIRFGKISAEDFELNMKKFTGLEGLSWEVDRIHLIKKKDKTQKIGKVYLE